MKNGGERKTETDRKREHKCSGRPRTWRMGGIRAERGGGGGDGHERRKGERGGIRGDVIFRISTPHTQKPTYGEDGVGFRSPLNLHSQRSLFLPLITWLSSDQSAASPALQMGLMVPRAQEEGEGGSVT